MSEKTFAVASISVAFVWGTFFYPPAPQVASPAQSTVTLEQPEGARASDAARESVKLGLAPASQHQASLSRSAPDMHKASLHDCPIGAGAADDCAPLPKLAGH